MPLPSPAALFDLTGRRALVTGSSRGLGFAIARALAGAGAAVILNGRDPVLLARAASALTAEGAEVRVSSFDVTEGVAVAAAVAALTEDEPIDILVNNAGIQRRGPLEDLPEADWRAVIDTDLTALFLVARAVV